MTSLQIVLPDDLAREAAREGLLAPEPLERLLREHIRDLRLARLAESRIQPADSSAAPAMTTEEIQAEIAAYRAEQRRAAGS